MRSLGTRLVTLAAAGLGIVSTTISADAALAQPLAALLPDASHADVVAVHVNRDGSGSATLYQPAANVTTVELYAELKSSGVADLVDPHTRVALDPQQCYHNSAFAFQDGICPPKTWTYQGHPRPVVYFRDYTGSAWPVNAAVTTWNSSVAIDSHWIASEVQCPTNVHCVPVSEGNWTGGFCGRTNLVWDANNHFVDGSVTIQFNNTNFANGTCKSTHRSTACHELGHGLGLSHNTSTTSCLYGSSVSNRSDIPNSDDYWVLANISY